jgi:Type II secretion system (T2SS), protein E, N-terminal domain
MVQALRRSWIRVVRQRVFPPPCVRLDCGATAAARIWRRSPPIRMQHTWLCSAQCVEKEARVIFDQVASAPISDASPNHRVPLGLLMLEHGYVNEQQLRTALEMQSRERKGRIGEWLHALHFVTERQLLTVLGVQWACPLLSLRQEPDTFCARMLPVQLLRALHLFPVRFIPATRILFVAASLGLNYRVLAAIDQMVDCRTTPCLIGDSEMQEWLRRAQNLQRDVQVFDRSSGPAEMARITGSYVARLSPEEVRIVRCGPYVWARLMGGPSETDLLFTTKAMLE